MANFIWTKIPQTTLPVSKMNTKLYSLVYGKFHLFGFSILDDDFIYVTHPTFWPMGTHQRFSLKQNTIITHVM